MTTDVLSEALRGDASRLRGIDDPVALSNVIEEAAQYGLEPLVRRVLVDRGDWALVPQAVRRVFDFASFREGAVEVLRRREASRVCSALAVVGVEMLILKGGALAYTHYAAAYLRPRFDLDLLVRDRVRDTARRTLEGLGYERSVSIDRDAIHRQVSYTRTESGFTHVIDLHWRIANRSLFAEMLSFDELALNAVAVAELGAGARTPGPVHSLLLACIHRVAHHNDSPNPLWLYDIKLIGERLSRAEWDEFWQLAHHKGVVAVCRRGLERASDVLDCSFESVEALIAPEPSAAYLGGTSGAWRNLRLDLSANKGALAKLRWLTGTVFPDARYMRQRYGAEGRLSLAAAYIRRGLSGCRRLVTVGFRKTSQFEV